jgi:hypothetical protein
MHKLYSSVVQLHKWCNCREWILVLLLLVGIFRIPTLVTPNFYGDEEIYFVMGRAWSTNVPMYEAMFDHKPPLIYVLAGIFSTIPLFRGLLLFSMLLHTVLFWKLSQKFWGEAHPYLAKLSSLIFVVLSTIPTFEGHIVNAELLMMLPVTASLLLVWPSKTGVKHSRLTYLIAGLIAGIGWLYKIPVVFDVVAIVLFLFVFAEKTVWKSIQMLFSARLWLYAFGFALPLLLSFAYYYLKGHGASYLATVFTVNLGYVSSWKSDDFTTFNPFRSGLVVRGVVLLGYTFLLYCCRKKLDSRLLFGALWGGFALFGALLSYRPYPHYLQELVPAASLLLPTLFTTQAVIGWLLWAMIIGVSLLVQRDVGFWAYESKTLYRNYWDLVTKRLTPDEYRNRFDNVARNYAISDYIKSRIGEEERIYVWGSDPTIYNLTNKIPSGGKYIVSFHVRDLRKHDYVMENLMEQEPKAIVLLSGSESFAELEALLSARYVLTYEHSGSVVYWRVD